jgi:Restriction endonuclease S subunits
MATRVGLGKATINSIPVAINQDLKALLPYRDNLIPRYLLFFLMSYTSMIEKAGAGATVKGVTLEYLRKIRVPVPSRPEQERIVAILDAAEELRRLREQADRHTADLIPALFHEMFETLATNKKWPRCRVDQAGEVQLGRQRAPKYQTGKWTRPYLRVANVFEDRIDISDLLSMDFDNREFETYRLKDGDILLNEGQSTELVGRPAMWRNEKEGCCFQNTLIRFRGFPDKVVPEFALAVLLSNFRSGEFSKISSKTSNVAHLGAGRFSGMPFPLPPISLQRAFAARVAGIRAMAPNQVSSRRRLDNLFQSLLYRAFRGKL